MNRRDALKAIYAACGAPLATLSSGGSASAELFYDTFLPGPPDEWPIDAYDDFQWYLERTKICDEFVHHRVVIPVWIDGPVANSLKACGLVIDRPLFGMPKQCCRVADVSWQRGGRVKGKLFVGRPEEHQVGIINPETGETSWFENVRTAISGDDLRFVPRIDPELIEDDA